MVSCKHCASPNALDSTFCRKCGTALPEEDLKEAQRQLETLISEGLHKLSQGRVDEAEAIAEAAVIENPVHVPGLQLKANVAVERGNLGAAVELYERVVELQPDSTVDRVRLNQLRAALSDKATAPAFDRRLVLLALAAVVVLVVCQALITWRVRQNTALAQREAAPTVQPTEEPTAQSGFYDPAAPATNPSTNPNPANPGTTNPSEPVANPGTGNAAQSSPAQAERPLPTAPDRSLGLPRASESLPPLRIEPDLPGTLPSTTVGVQPTNPPSSPPRRGPDEDPSTQPVPSDPRPSTPPPVEDPGVIEINVRKDGPRTSVPSGTQVDGGGSQAGLTALLRAARDQFQIGNYAGAAASYERARALGADPISTNQRLGQAYAQLGRNSEAISAYRRAIAAAEQSLARGGNADRYNTVIATCRQALKVLGG